MFNEYLEKSYEQLEEFNLAYRVVSVILPPDIDRELLCNEKDKIFANNNRTCEDNRLYESLRNYSRVHREAKQHGRDSEAIVGKIKVSNYLYSKLKRFNLIIKEMSK